MDQVNAARDVIVSGDTALGIEFGSTRIKAVLIGPDQQPLATGGFEWPLRWHWARRSADEVGNAKPGCR